MPATVPAIVLARASIARPLNDSHSLVDPDLDRGRFSSIRDHSRYLEELVDDPVRARASPSVGTRCLRRAVRSAYYFLAGIFFRLTDSKCSFVWWCDSLAK